MQSLPLTGFINLDTQTPELSTNIGTSDWKFKGKRLLSFSQKSTLFLPPILVKDITIHSVSYPWFLLLLQTPFSHQSSKSQALPWKYSFHVFPLLHPLSLCPSPAHLVFIFLSKGRLAFPELHRHLDQDVNWLTYSWEREQSHSVEYLLWHEWEFL